MPSSSSGPAAAQSADDRGPAPRHDRRFAALLAVVVVAGLVWRAWATYYNETVPFLSRLAATTAMTEHLADEWLDARLAESGLLTALLQVALPRGDSLARRPYASAAVVLGRAMASLGPESGLGGAWLMSESGDRLAGRGVRPDTSERVRALLGRAQGAPMMWTELRGDPPSALVAIASRVVSDASLSADDPVEPALLLLLYDPAAELLPSVVNVPVPSLSARNRVYARRAGTLFELTLASQAPPPGVPVDSVPISIRRALAGRESVGPDATLAGEAAHVSTRHLERLDWVLVRTIDQSETFAVAFWPRYGVEAAVLLLLAAGLLAGMSAHRRTLARAELEAELARSQLRSLQLQLQPHFLLNALAGVAALVRQNPGRAEALVHRISDFLHSTLRAVGVHEVSLGRELELLREYLAVAEFRLGDTLHVTIDVPPEAQTATVPTLVLQPLAENVIRHAYLGPEAVTTLEITAERRGGTLIVLLRDNGRGGAGRTAGIGLGNTRSRLERLYGGTAALSIRDRPEGGTEVELRLPFRD